MAFAIALILSILMCMVFYTDVREYKIPNWLNATLLVLFFVWLPFAPQMPDLLSTLYAFLAVFTVGYILFMFNVMGGGDVKLLAVLAPWCGWGKTLVTLLVYVGLLGGLLAVVALVCRFSIPALGARMGWKTIPRIFSHKEPLPYGLAIGAAFLIILWNNELAVVPLR